MRRTHPSTNLDGWWAACRGQKAPCLPDRWISENVRITNAPALPLSSWRATLEGSACASLRAAARFDRGAHAREKLVRPPGGSGCAVFARRRVGADAAPADHRLAGRLA